MSTSHKDEVRFDVLMTDLLLRHTLSRSDAIILNH